GVVYCSDFLGHDVALEKLLSSVEGEKLVKPNHIRFRTGARRKQWHRNCVAVGLSGGFMEPLESTSIHLIQRAILRIVRMLPAGAISQRDIDEFNDQQFTDMEQIRDFLVLHYKVTDRRDTPFWRHVSAMDVPESLTHKIELFRETGRVFRKNEELFAENSWVQVMMGQGIMPQSHHPVAAKLRDEEMAHLFGTLRDQVARTVAALPVHGDYVVRYCGADVPVAA
ncbi:MAG: tryptophan halogenase, partial [Novosphingobium sp. 16-62-11]